MAEAIDEDAGRPSEASVASSMIGSLPSVTVSSPVGVHVGAVNLPLATSLGVTALNLMAGSAWANRPVTLYTQHVRDYLKPYLGSVPLRSLTRCASCRAQRCDPPGAA